MFYTESCFCDCVSSVFALWFSALSLFWVVCFRRFSLFWLLQACCHQKLRKCFDKIESSKVDGPSSHGNVAIGSSLQWKCSDLELRESAASEVFQSMFIFLNSHVFLYVRPRPDSAQDSSSLVKRGLRCFWAVLGCSTEVWLGPLLFTMFRSSILRILQICDLPVRAAKFISRRNWIVTGSDDMHVRIFDYSTSLSSPICGSFGLSWVCGMVHLCKYVTWHQIFAFVFVHL